MRAVVGIVLLSVGCSDSYFRDRAVKTAASEHRCSGDRVRIKNIVAEDRMHGDFSYWLDATHNGYLGLLALHLVI
jgi:hypothetical protein